MDAEVGLVSVIVPAYNRAKTIGSAIESVFAQGYAPIEIIVVDDGSTDATSEVVAGYGERVGYLALEHSGSPAFVRNAGIRASRGEFVAFLDSDDLWLPGKLEQQMRFFEQEPEVGMVCGKYVQFEEESGPDSEVQFPEAGGFAELFSANFVGTLTVVIRRSCLDAVGVFDERLLIAEDYELWLRVASQYEIRMLGEVVARYRRHSGNLTANQRELFEGELIALERACDLQRRLGIRLSGSLVRHRLVDPLVGLGRYHLKSGSYREARICFGRALRLDALRWRTWKKYLRSLRRELRGSWSAFGSRPPRVP